MSKGSRIRFLVCTLLVIYFYFFRLCWMCSPKGFGVELGRYWGFWNDWYAPYSILALSEAIILFYRISAFSFFFKVSLTIIIVNRTSKMWAGYTWSRNELQRVWNYRAEKCEQPHSSHRSVNSDAQWWTFKPQHYHSCLTLKKRKAINIYNFTVSYISFWCHRWVLFGRYQHFPLPAKHTPVKKDTSLRD